jgi:MFS family permease
LDRYRRWLPELPMLLPKGLDGLWRHPDFLRLWAAQAIADFGSQITLLALPLTAAVMLHATPFEMGVLRAIEVLPFALFSLHAGVLIDRTRRMPLMLWRDLLVAAVLLLVPIAAWQGWLNMLVLWGVGFLAMTGEVIGGSAHQSYVAGLVGKSRLVEANAKLMTTGSAAQLMAPGLAGVLIQWLTAPFAIVANALTYIVSALVLRGIRHIEARPEGAGNASVWIEIREGLRFVWHTPLLRAFAIQTALWQWFNHMLQAVLVLYATRTLGLTPAQMGVCFMLSGAGSLIAALTAEHLGARFGTGPMVGWGFVATAVGALGFTVLHADYWPMLGFALAQGLYAFGATMFSIHYLAARAALTPDAMLGRMISTMRFVTVAPAPLGALVGGLVATWLGLRGGLMAVGAGAALLAWFTMARSRTRHLHHLPRHLDEC